MPVGLFRLGLFVAPLELYEQRPSTGDEEQIVGPACVAPSNELDWDAWYTELMEGSVYHGVFDPSFLTSHSCVLMQAMAPQIANPIQPNTKHHMPNGIISTSIPSP